MSPEQGKNRQSVIVPRRMRWGLLAYQLPSGYLFANEDGDVLNIEVQDITDTNARKVLTRKLAEAALYYGAPEGGDVVFIPGKMRVSDEQYSVQMDQLRQGEDIEADWHPDDILEEE